MKKIRLEWLSSVNFRVNLGCEKLRTLKVFHDVLTDKFSGIVYKVDNEELDCTDPELGVNESIPYIFYDDAENQAYIALFDISFFNDSGKVCFSVNSIMDNNTSIKNSIDSCFFYTDDDDEMSCITRDGQTIGITKV